MENFESLLDFTCIYVKGNYDGVLIVEENSNVKVPRVILKKEVEQTVKSEEILIASKTSSRWNILFFRHG